MAMLNAYGFTEKHTHTQTEMQKYRNTYRYKDRPTDRRTYRQIERQKHINTFENRLQTDRLKER